MIGIDGQGLTLDQVARVARGGEAVRLTEAAAERVEEGWRHLRALVAEGRPVYGLTTGFGALDGRTIPRELNAAQQRCLLKSHAAGIGPAMGADAVRAMMAIRR